MVIAVNPKRRVSSFRSTNNRSAISPKPRNLSIESELKPVSSWETKCRKGIDFVGFPININYRFFLCVSNTSWQGDDLPVANSHSFPSVMKLVFVLVMYRLVRTGILLENVSPDSKGKRLIWNNLLFFFLRRQFNKL